MRSHICRPALAATLLGSAASVALNFTLSCTSAMAEPGASESGILQRTCRNHYAMKTAHIKISASLPNGWKEESELWIDRPGRLSFHTAVTSSAPGGPGVESQVLAEGGKTTIWSSQPNPAQPEMKNVYIKFDTPSDVTGLEKMPVARFGLAQFVLRLMTGEPARLSVARIGENGKIEYERKILSPSPTELVLLAESGRDQDELSLDASTGLLKMVRARAAGQVLASGEINYLSVNEPIAPGAFDWKPPAGAREIKSGP